MTTLALKRGPGWGSRMREQDAGYKTLLSWLWFMKHFEPERQALESEEERCAAGKQPGCSRAVYFPLSLPWAACLKPRLLDSARARVKVL